MEQPDYYTGFTQAQVETILASQQAELPKALASWTTSGDQVIKRKLDDIHKVIAACQAALKRFDPDKYGRHRRVGASHVGSTFQM